MRSTSPADPFPFTAGQRNLLFAAKAWWQEGERSLDYLAEQGRQELVFARLRPLWDALKVKAEPQAGDIAPILRLVRTLSANRALNRLRETDEFARRVKDLLFGAGALPERIAEFLQIPYVGRQTASQLLWAAFPNRFPLVSPVTRGVLNLTSDQLTAARDQAVRAYDLHPPVPSALIGLLTDFQVYEAVRRLLGVADFTAVNAVLWHAREMPPTAPLEPRTAVVREIGELYTAQLGPDPDEIGLLRLIEGQIAAQGFTYPSLMLRNYYIALKAKPFVLLTGLSGTGKTRLTRLLSDALTGGAQDQYLLIPVRPDWHDSTSLLGYRNPVTDRFVSTPFVEFVRTAALPENRSRVYSVCLDEMNLARPEHFFTEMLSAMETPERTIALADGTATFLAPQLLITGSVNMDESTYAFSRKLLDRANTIEFSEVTFSLPPPSSVRDALPDIAPAERQQIFLAGCVRTFDAALQRLRAIRPDWATQVQATLTALNEFLEPRGMHFAYRVRNEIYQYLAAAFTPQGAGLLETDPEANFRLALDLQIVQKVLPRISGTEEALERLLRELESWAEGEGFPRVAAKVRRMRTRASEDGIVSFYEV